MRQATPQMAIRKLSDDLSPIPTETMADIVETRLQEYFKKKAFKPGDSLPTEMELVDALGVSRNVVREALSRLRMLGMVETRKKRGMILARPDILGTFERVLDPLIIDEPILRDLFELRLTLEMGLADLLFLRKTDKDIAQLEKIALAEKKDGEKKFRVQNEIAFHGKLYEITGNNTLKRFQTMLMPVFGYVTTLEKNKEYESGTVNHLDLVEILKAGTKEDFKTGMYAHLKPHYDNLSKK